MGEREDLARLGEQRVSLPAGFEIAREVRSAALRWPVHSRFGDPYEPYPAAAGNVAYAREDLCCNACGQSIAVLKLRHQSFAYSSEEIEGSLLSHLMIAHNWTRETIGDPPPDHPGRDRVGSPAPGAPSP